MKFRSMGCILRRSLLRTNVTAGPATRDRLLRPRCKPGIKIRFGAMGTTTATGLRRRRFLDVAKALLVGAGRDASGTTAKAKSKEPAETPAVRSQKLASNFRNLCSSSHCCWAFSLVFRKSAQRWVAFSVFAGSFAQAAFDCLKLSWVRQRLSPGKKLCSIPVRTSCFNSK